MHRPAPFFKHHQAGHPFKQSAIQQQMNRLRGMVFEEVATHDATLIERYQKRTLRLEKGTLVADERGAKAARLMSQTA